MFVAFGAIGIVLPAETGKDPTGIGGILGLTQIGARKNVAPDAGELDRIDRLADGGYRAVIELRPFGSREVKGKMGARETMQFRWQVDGAAVEYEFHGDPADGADYQSYAKGTSIGEEGEFTAPFTGIHGWYWHNLSPETVTVEAIVEGAIRTQAEHLAARCGEGCGERLTKSHILFDISI